MIKKFKNKQVMLMLLTLILLCGICFGTDKYVAPDTGTDDGAGGRGDTSGDPYATIQFALDNMGGSGTVFLMPGTYTSATQPSGGDFWVDATQSNWDIIVESHTTEVTIISSDNLYGFRCMAGYTGNMTLKDLAIVSTDTSNSAIVRIDNTVQCTLTLDNVDVGDGTAGQTAIRLATAGNVNRTLTLINGTTVNATVRTLWIESADSVVIDGSGGEITLTSDYIGDMFDMRDTINSFMMNDATIVNSGDASSAVAVLEFDQVTSCEYVRIENCTISTTGKLKRIIDIPKYVKAIYILDNDITIDTDVTSAVAIGVGANGGANSNPYQSALIDGNTIQFIGAANSHGILAGTSIDWANEVIGVSQITNNIVLGADLGIVAKDTLDVVIQYNYVCSERGIILKDSAKCKVQYNTSIATGGDTSTDAALEIYTVGVQDPEYNICENNILISDGADYALAVVNGNWFTKSDYNCLYSTGDNIAFIDTSDITTLSGLQAAWAAETGTPYTDNDENSINEDPLLANQAINDHRLLPGSPCLNTGKPTLQNGYSSMGAWQQKQRGSR